MKHPFKRLCTQEEHDKRVEEAGKLSLHPELLKCYFDLFMLKETPEENSLGLKRLSLEGFKSFEDKADLKLGKLNLLFGTNSAGKSSINEALDCLSNFSIPPEFVNNRAKNKTATISAEFNIKASNIFLDQKKIGVFPEDIYQEKDTKALSFWSSVRGGIWDVKVTLCSNDHMELAVFGLPLILGENAGTVYINAMHPLMVFYGQGNKEMQNIFADAVAEYSKNNPNKDQIEPADLLPILFPLILQRIDRKAPSFINQLLKSDIVIDKHSNDEFYCGNGKSEGESECVINSNDHGVWIRLGDENISSFTTLLPIKSLRESYLKGSFTDDLVLAQDLSVITKELISKHWCGIVIDWLIPLIGDQVCETLDEFKYEATQQTIRQNTAIYEEPSHDEIDSFVKRTSAAICRETTLTEMTVGRRTYIGPVRTRASLSDINQWGSDAKANAGELFWVLLRDFAGTLLPSHKKTLIQAINQWLGILGFDLSLQHYSRYQSKDISLTESEFNALIDQEISQTLASLIDKKPLLELVVRGANTQVDVNTVGSGFSQVLPVLVALHLCDRSLIFVEQPELHLHPALQADLADCFLHSLFPDTFPNIQTAIDRIEPLVKKEKSNSELGSQAYPSAEPNTVFIETHSEHLLLRVLRRIREVNKAEKSSFDPSQVKVFFFEKANGATTVYDLPVTEDGDFSRDWPGGFFPERDLEFEL